MLSAIMALEIATRCVQRQSHRKFINFEGIIASPVAVQDKLLLGLRLNHVGPYQSLYFLTSLLKNEWAWQQPKLVL